MTSAEPPPIIQERLLPAPLERVFSAWSDPESLGRWMCPGELDHAEVELDFRVGGSFRIVMKGENSYPHRGEYLVIDPPKRLAFTWVSEWFPEELAHTRVSVTLEEAGEGQTRIRLVHEALPVGDTYDGHTEGWRSILEKFAEVLAASA